MRVVHGWTAWLAAAVVCGPVWASGQTLVASRAFSGSGMLSVSRPGAGVARQQVGVEASFAAYQANLVITRPGQGPVSVAYGVLEIPAADGAWVLLFRGGADADPALPRLVVGRAETGAAGTSLAAFSLLSGTDALGRYSGILVLQLQQAPKVDPPAPPVVDPPGVSPDLPSFDGTTLRVPARWEVAKFEGFAVRLAAKYGTLPGGTTATVPPGWTDGVMQCHGGQGFVYELPLMVNYEGFVNGSILYARDNTFPPWEDPDRWHPIATGPGHVKYVFR